MSLSLLQCLAKLAQQLPENHCALRDRSVSLSYWELIDRVKVIADWLAEQPQTVIAVRAENQAAWIVIDLACQVAEKVLLPIPLFFSDLQIDHCLRQSGVGLLLADEADGDVQSRLGLDHPEVISPVPNSRWRVYATGHAPVDLPNGCAKITFTSGSTGNPKGVCLSNLLQWQVAASLADVVAIQSPLHLCVLPLATLLENIAGVYTPLLSGGTVVLASASELGMQGSSQLQVERFLACLCEQQPQSLILVPQLLQVLVAACAQGWSPPSSLSFIAVGGAKVAPDLIRAAHAYKLPVYEGYGLSECGSVVALNRPDDDRQGCVGKLLPHCAVTIENDEIIVSGACHLGYLGEPETWYPQQVRTGDIGAWQEEFLTVAGRKKNVLISSYGRNINPEWVESEILANPRISQCVVLGDGRPHLIALVATSLESTDVATWIKAVNSNLPDYARVKAWRCLPTERWRQLLTDNGRPRRDLLPIQCEAEITDLYQPALTNSTE